MRVAVVHNIPDRLYDAVAVPFVGVFAGTGADVETLRCDTFGPQVGVNGPTVHRGDGTPLSPDVVFARVVAQPSLRPVLAVLAATGVPVVNDPVAAERAGDKVQSALTLQACGVSTVPTTLLVPGAVWSNRVYHRYTPSVVTKPVRGWQGNGVCRADTPAALEQLRDDQPEDGLWIGQPELRSTTGGDLRVLVVGGVAIAAMVRTPARGEWRANTHLGAKGSPHELSDDERGCAEAAAAACGLHVAGVDILPTEHGPYVLEVNPNPGIAIGDVTGVDVTAAIAVSVLSAHQPQR